MTNLGEGTGGNASDYQRIVDRTPDFVQMGNREVHIVTRREPTPQEREATGDMRKLDKQFATTPAKRENKAKGQRRK